MSHQFEVFPFGKYKGVPIEEIPLTYIVYALLEFSLPEDLANRLECELVTALKLPYLRLDVLKTELESKTSEEILKELFDEDSQDDNQNNQGE